MFGTKMLEERRSKYNGVLRVVKSFGFGTYIQAGGITQSGGVVGDIWGPVIRKIWRRNGEIKRVLILGLGGGTVVKYVRKYWPGSKIVGVDIDPVIIELGRKYLDLEVEKIYVQDASVPLSGKFDLVIVDLYHGEKFPRKFESEIFLNLVGKYIGDNGIAAFNRIYFGKHIDEAIKFEKKLKRVFKNVGVFRPKINIVYLIGL